MKTLARSLFKRETTPLAQDHPSHTEQVIPFHTTNMPSEKNISLKRFSNSRSVYWTTSTIDGRIVQVTEPMKQFKTSLHPSSHASSPLASQPLVQTSYRSSDLKITDYDEQDQEKFGKRQTLVKKLFKRNDKISGKLIKSLKVNKTLHKMVTGVKESEIGYDCALPLLKKLIYNSHQHIDDRIDELYKNPDDYAISRWGSCSLEENLHLTAFHAHHMYEWRRIRRYFIDIIEECHATALLSMTWSKYELKYTSSSSTYRDLDNSLSYAILALIHFPLFYDGDNYIHFWRCLSRCSEKTKFVIEFVDNVFRQSHKSFTTPILGHREVLRRHLSMHYNVFVERIEFVRNLFLTTHVTGDLLPKRGGFLRIMSPSWALKLCCKIEKEYNIMERGWDHYRSRRRYRDMRNKQNYIEKKKYKSLPNRMKRGLGKLFEPKKSYIHCPEVEYWLEDAKETALINITMDLGERHYGKKNDYNFATVEKFSTFKNGRWVI